MATYYAPQVSLLIGNTGGNVQTLPPDQLVGGKTRVWIERFAMNGAVLGDQIVVARLPVGSAPVDIVLVTTTTLGAATNISLGDKNNTSRFSASGAFTTTDTPTSKLNAASAGVPLTTGYQYDGTASTSTGPVAYEDILLTILGSSLPLTGTLVVMTYYQDYGV